MAISSLSVPSIFPTSLDYGEGFGAPTISTGTIPVGAIIGWAKSLDASMTILPSGWYECDGSTVNGIILPDLNITKRFLRGSTTSGTTGGSDTHNHSVSLPERPDQSGIGTAWYGGGSSSVASSSESSLPACYEIVWIIRVF